MSWLIMTDGTIIHIPDVEIKTPALTDKREAKK